MSNSENTSNNMLLVSFDDFEIRKSVSIPVVAGSGPCLHMVLSETRSPRPRARSGGCLVAAPIAAKVRSSFGVGRVLAGRFLRSSLGVPGLRPAAGLRFAALEVFAQGGGQPCSACRLVLRLAGRDHRSLQPGRRSLNGMQCVRREQAEPDHSNSAGAKEASRPDQ